MRRQPRGRRLQSRSPVALVRPQTDQTDGHEAVNEVFAVRGETNAKALGGPSGPRPSAADCRSLRFGPPKPSQAVIVRELADLSSQSKLMSILQPRKSLAGSLA